MAAGLISGSPRQDNGKRMCCYPAKAAHGPEFGGRPPSAHPCSQRQAVIEFFICRPGCKFVRKWFKQISPDRESLLANRWLRPVAHRLTHPEIWHFNRRNVARGVALGLFVGFILPIGQIVVAALLAASARGNLLVAAMATLITNPFTFPPIYYAAYQTGSFLLKPVLDGSTSGPHVDERQGGTMFEMLTSASLPTLFGLLLFATISAAAGFGMVHVAWRLSLRRQWRRRGQSGNGSDSAD